MKDPGLMVELKRYLAKRGDQLRANCAARRFDRRRNSGSLEPRCAVSRGGHAALAAVRLPDSRGESGLADGKEEELVLKERARRLVQIESQEDAEFSTRGKNEMTEVDRSTSAKKHKWRKPRARSEGRQERSERRKLPITIKRHRVRKIRRNFRSSSRNRSSSAARR